MPTLGRDGVWYAGDPMPATGAWRRAARTLTAPFRALRGVATRAITSLPWIAGGTRQATITAETAMSLVPVWACVRILANSIASLPVKLYRRDGNDGTPLSYIPALLFRPAALDDLFQWINKCVYSLVLRGNAYGLIIQRDGLGFPTMIEWLNPDDVWVDESRPTLPVYYWMGVEVPREHMFHVAWMVPPGFVNGLSPMQLFAKTIGTGISATDYGLRWFDNGGTPPGTMRNSQKTITRDESEEIRDRLMASIRSGKPLVYGADWEFTALQVSPEESQFISTMRLNATQIAAIYGVPPEMVGGETGGSYTYSSPEQRQIEFVNMTLRPWLVLLESRLSALMPGREFVKFNADAMIRADTLTRYQAHNLALAGNWKVINDIRALEDLPPVPWGDKPVSSTGTAPEQPQIEGSPSE
jgi:HK97 family phage portal protein